MNEIFTFSEQNWSCGCTGEGGDNGLFSDAASGGNGAAAESCQVIAIAMGDLLDQTELAQAPKIAGDTRHGEMGQEGLQIGTTNAPEVELWTLQGTEQSLLRRVEEVETLERMAVDGLGAGESMQVAVAGGEVVERGKVLQVASVTAEQNFAQVDETVDRLLEGATSWLSW